MIPLPSKRKVGNVMKTKTAEPPKYMAKVIEKGLTAQKGVVSFLPIYHDDWCALLKGNGVCNCNPEVGEPEVAQ